MTRQRTRELDTTYGRQVEQIRQALAAIEELLQAGDEGECVEGGSNLDVVVEEGHDVARWRRGGVGVEAAGGVGLEVEGGGGWGLATGPGEDAVGPKVERGRGVAAGVQLLGAVETDVDERGGGVEEEWPLDGVGNGEADVVLAEKGKEVGGAEALVADLEGVTEGKVERRFEDGAGEHAVVAALGERGGGAGGAGEKGEEVGEAGSVEVELRRELPKDGAEFGSEGEQAAGEKVGEGHFDVTELLHVGEEARALEGEEEVVRGLGGPAAEVLGALEGVEGAVDLDGGKVLGGELELATLREFRRIEDAAPRFVAPAGDADADLAAGGGAGEGVGGLAAQREIGTRLRWQCCHGYLDGDGMEASVGAGCGLLSDDDRGI